MSSKKDNSAIGDVIKKVVSIGVGAAFMTEDTVKNVLGELPLSKDIVSGLVDNAKSAKEEFSKSIREEFKNRLNKIDPNHIVDEIVAKYDIEVNATFKFKKKENDQTGE